jgi:hypothetical protein
MNNLTEKIEILTEKLKNISYQEYVQFISIPKNCFLSDHQKLIYLRQIISHNIDLK